MPFSDDVLGRPGFLHGGAIGRLLEMAAIVALHAALESEGGGRLKPNHVTDDDMRGCREKETRAQGHVTRLRPRVGNVQAAAWQDDATKPSTAQKHEDRQGGTGGASKG